MRVMMAGPLQRSQGRVVLAFFYLYFLLHWATGIFMFAEKIGFSYASVLRYYLGDTDMFLPPRSFIGLLEVSHFHLFAMGLFYVVFTHLLLLTPVQETVKEALCRALGLALLGDMAAGWLIRYVAAPFAWLKLGSFYLLQGASIALFFILILMLYRQKTGN